MVTEQSSIAEADGSVEPKRRRSGLSGGPPSNDVSAARALAPLVRSLLGGEIPVRFELWDGSGFGPTDSSGTLHVRSADALRRILWAPGELGFARAYVAGDIEIEGDMIAMLASLALGRSPRPAVGPAGAAGRLRCRLSGRGHRAAIAGAARGGAGGGTSALPQARRPGRHAPLRRRQRLLRARARAEHDLLVRTFRRCRT